MVPTSPTDPETPRQTATASSACPSLYVVSIVYLLPTTLLTLIGVGARRRLRVRSPADVRCVRRPLPWLASAWLPRHLGHRNDDVERPHQRRCPTSHEGSKVPSAVLNLPTIFSSPTQYRPGPVRQTHFQCTPKPLRQTHPPAFAQPLTTSCCLSSTPSTFSSRPSPRFCSPSSATSSRTRSPSPASPPSSFSASSPRPSPFGLCGRRSSRSWSSTCKCASGSGCRALCTRFLFSSPTQKPRRCGRTRKIGRARCDCFGDVGPPGWATKRSRLYQTDLPQAQLRQTTGAAISTSPLPVKASEYLSPQNKQKISPSWWHAR
ncbi:hypothetical protein BDY21DRAFT_25788 [Lineolata rhizophorae]|uniref:Uncharacterized protein n=1 Tax=Lineolata rhizophorae TaxID=578093 RepID=A0A6A6P0L9_9PEZI|nr:hypothetical protein BDY21DRAFT_25788 [Lineolata rhizophorae]